ncbi:MAG: signal peptidase II, partial [Lachnospiraceae bacterium]|nr:signal peptidase II [Lachnospiraceae bacterium]
IEANFDFKRQEYDAHKLIRVHKYHNPGAFLNLMQHKKKLLHGISVVFTLMIALVFMLTLFQKGNRVLKLGLALLLCGAFSNTYDRLSRNYVVDYFSFCTPWKKFNQIVFNISDFCILIGTLLVVLKTENF